MKKFKSSECGFCLKHSITHAIAAPVGEILQGCNDDMYTLALFINLGKFFNGVDHNMLLNKEITASLG